LRRSEPTFGKHFAVEISAENRKQLLVPKGFAHGFIVLTDFAEVFYKCDEFYKLEADAGIHYKSIDIDWKLPADQLILSDKDKNLPALENAKFEF
jgi:dTDP-4-dehydrorhamnose 3,5-epimerase